MQRKRIDGMNVSSAGREGGENMEKNIITIAMWVLFVGGIFGFIMGMQAYLAGKSPAEYGVMGLGGGLYMFWSGVLAFLKNKK